MWLIFWLIIVANAPNFGDVFPALVVGSLGYLIWIFGWWVKNGTSRS